MVNMEQKSVRTSKWPTVSMWSAVVLIAVYVGFILYILGPLSIFSFLSKDNQELNSVGDFLAGVFAPPAFVLLVLAVVLQRIELKAVQKELAASAKVIREQLSAVADQNKLSLQAAQATVDVALLERRLELVQELVQVKSALKSLHNGAHTDIDWYFRLYRALMNIKFICSENLVSELGSIFDAVHEYTYGRDLKLQIHRWASADTAPVDPEIKELRGRIDAWVEIFCDADRLNELMLRHHKPTISLG